jgi:predicted alpha/beta hydrolase
LVKRGHPDSAIFAHNPAISLKQKGFLINCHFDCAGFGPYLPLVATKSQVMHMKSTSEIQAKDGTPIGITTYSPKHANGKVMIIAPTGSANQGLYQLFAGFFQLEGFVVITFDYRGIGRSLPGELKGFAASMQQWAVQDIDAVILFARNHYPMQEIIYVGHCVGGEIVGLARASQYINKLVLVNSALSCKKLWPLRYRFRIITTRTIVRWMNRWFGYFPGKRIGYTDNVPGNVIYEWVNWCCHANGLFDKFPDNNYRKLQIPLLAFSFSDNWNTPRKAVSELLNRFSGAMITWHHLTPSQAGAKKIGHSGFFNSSHEKTMWTRLRNWIHETDHIRDPI